MNAVLPHVRRGAASPLPPVVLLHGFAGNAASWTPVQVLLEGRRETIAFDLPGHGHALGWPRIGHAGVSAEAVTGSLDGLGLPEVHLVGHSMGGAVAALIALRDRQRVASLTLLAPGGFGRRIDAALLRAFARAREEAELAALAARFVAPGFRMPRRLAALLARERAEAGRIEALTVIAEAILDGDGQRTVDVAGLARTGLPVRVVWGRQDAVIPVAQAMALPGEIAVHLFDGVGHMPQAEIPAAVVRIIADSLAASGR